MSGEIEIGTIDEARAAMRNLMLDDEALSAVVCPLMHIRSLSAVPPAAVEHYREVAAAVALLIAMRLAGKSPGFDAMKLIRGFPRRASRVVLAQRLAELNGTTLQAIVGTHSK